MDTTSQYRDIIQRVIQLYATQSNPQENSRTEMIFDGERDRYLLLEVGWQRGERVYMTLMHLDLIDGKIWIQDDGTEEGVATLLMEVGVPKEHIVLGFYPESHRAHTEFAVG